ncbi:uncharacterized protein [Amphiura filiformis]|uniref:uncharacterized protein n=1 Tax=Amphiura filiformis TaxID=82378 RepID=UPI003B2181CF
MKCPETDMEGSSSDQLNHLRDHHSDRPPGEDAYSLTSSARLRAVKLTTPGSLLLLSLILIGCGIAMILGGITLWFHDGNVKGITIAGVLIFSIGMGIGLGAWYVRRKARFEREHRMPVVTVSLSQTLHRENSVLEGEYNSALDVSPTYAIATTPTGSTNAWQQPDGRQHSNVTYYHDYSDGGTSPGVRGAVVNIHIHNSTSTPSNKMSKSHSNRIHGSFPTSRQQPPMHSSTPSLTNNEGRRSLSNQRGYSDFPAATSESSTIDGSDHSDYETLHLQMTKDARYSPVIHASSSVMDHNANVSIDCSNVHPSIAYEQYEENPPPTYFECVEDNLDTTVV